MIDVSNCDYCYYYCDDAICRYNWVLNQYDLRISSSLMDNWEGERSFLIVDKDGRVVGSLFLTAKRVCNDFIGDQFVYEFSSRIEME